jgi:hypothetical protein
MLFRNYFFKKYYMFLIKSQEKSKLVFFSILLIKMYFLLIKISKNFIKQKIFF